MKPCFWGMEIKDTSVLSCRSCRNLLSVFAPGINPGSISAGEGVASSVKDFPNAIRAKCMKAFSCGIIGDIEA